MKTLGLSILILFCLCKTGLTQGVRISTDNLDPDNSAMLDVVSTNRGILIPRMTSAQRTGIASPATGLMVFQSDGTSGFYYFNGTIWVSLSQPGGAAGGDLTGTFPNPTINTGAVNSNKILDGSIIDNDISGTAAVAGTKIDPDFGTQNITTTGRAGIGTGTVAANNRLEVNDGHWQTSQTVQPTITFNSGTYSGSASVSTNPPSTDVAGRLSFNVTVAGGCGGCSYFTLNFNQAYSSIPIVVISPANVWAALRQKEWEMYVVSSATGFSIRSNQFPTVTASFMEFNYFVIETE